MKNRTDEQLMDLYQHGSEAAAAELFARYSGPLEGRIVNLLKTIAPALISDAQDIVQNVFTFVHTYRHRFISGTQFWPWLYATAGRMVRNHIEHETRQQRDGRRKQALPPSCRDLADTALTRDKTKVQDCMSALPPMHQQVIQLLYFDGCKAQEAADKLGIPKTALDWYKREALAMMRKWGNNAA
jgi:RNA polymerase sigma factor (sigma-70 family)